jgi:hypothetical protein
MVEMRAMLFKEMKIYIMSTVVSHSRKGEELSSLLEGGGENIV